MSQVLQDKLNEVHTSLARIAGGLDMMFHAAANSDQSSAFNMSNGQVCDFADLLKVEVERAIAIATSAGEFNG